MYKWFCNVSKISEPIIFADDPNLFFSHRNKKLFHNAKLEKNKVLKWYTLFHKACGKDNISLKLPSLFINDREIKQTTSIKYLGLLIDEHLTWKEHFTVIKNNVLKNLGLLYRARRVLEGMVLENRYIPLYIVTWIIET